VSVSSLLVPPSVTRQQLQEDAVTAQSVLAAAQGGAVSAQGSREGEGGDSMSAAYISTCNIRLGNLQLQRSSRNGRCRCTFRDD
jgi:hypothetical protein